MPALPPIASTLKCRFLFEDGSGFQIGFGAYFTYAGGPPSGTDLNTIATAFKDAWDTNFTSFLSTSISLISVTLRDLTSDLGAVGEWVGSVPGSDANPPLPIQTAAVFAHKINRTYRGGKPKTFLPIGTSTSVGGPHGWTGTFQAAAEAAFTAFISACGGATSGSTTIDKYVNVSYYSGFTNVPYGSPTKYRKVPTLRVNNVPPNPIPPDAIVASSIDANFGSQRRRTKATGS